MYVYITTPNAGPHDNDLHTVGFYAPDGQWHPESDHTSSEAAAGRAHWLNGGASKQIEQQIEQRLTALEEAEAQRAADDAQYLSLPGSTEA